MSATTLDAATLNSPALNFSLTNSHHQKRTLASYKGKILFINFWASWCAPCQQELPDLDRLAAFYEGKKVQVLTINVDKERTDAQKLLAQLHLDAAHFEVLWDSQSKVVSGYNIEVMPSSFIIDAKGVVRFAHVGFHGQDPQAWRQEIDGLLGKK